jgi:hypothetical protein
MSFAPERPPVANWLPREVKVSQTLNLKYWQPNLNKKQRFGVFDVYFVAKKNPALSGGK